MTNEDFYINMIMGSAPNSDLRKEWVKGIIRVLVGYQMYERNGENPKLDKIYDELVKINVKYTQEKGKSQVRTLLKKVNSG